MDFLQRHLPRVYQAVQNALVYFTNVTAQIFGAPPNAPQPRNARSNVPIKTPPDSESLTLSATPAEISGTQVTSASDISSDHSVSGITERNVGMPGPPTDAENQRQEADLRHRKGQSGGRLDLEHKISDDKDVLGGFHATMEKHTNLENTAHSYNKEVIDDLKQMESEELKDLSRSDNSCGPHAEDDPLIHLDMKKENRDSLTYQGKHLIPETDMLHEIDKLLSDLKHKDRGLTEDPYVDSPQEIENVCFQPNTLNVLAGNVLKEQSPGTDEEMSNKPEEMMCHINVTSQSKDIIITDDQESELSVDITASPMTMDYDDGLDVTGIDPKQHKKLVTPASESDNSPYEARKTWEDLQETAFRLTLHCDLFENDNQECQKPGHLTEMSESAQVGQLHSILTDEQGWIEEDVVNKSLVQYLKEIKGSSIEEEPVTGQSPLSEQSRSSGDGDYSSGEEQTDLMVEGEDAQSRTVIQEQTTEESGFAIGRSEENNQRNKRESHRKFSKSKKAKKRVHFSPSTEELIKKLDHPTTDTALIQSDYTLEGASQHTDENTGHQTSSYSIIIESSQSLNKNKDDDYLGDSNRTKDNGQPLSGPITAERDHTVWYDEDEIKTEADDGLCESIVDIVYQKVSVDFQMEETFLPITDSNAVDEHSYYLPSGQETHENETEPPKKTDAPLTDIVTLGQAELFLENVNKSMSHSEGESLESNQAEDTLVSDHSFEKENRSLSESDHYYQKGPDLAEDNTTSITESQEEIICSTKTEIKVDLPLGAITEPLNQKIYEQYTSVEDIDINEELLRTLSRDDTETSVIEKVLTAEELALEGNYEGLREANVPDVSDSQEVAYIYEEEEQLHYLPEEVTEGKQNDFSRHEEKLQPENSISQEDGREVENGYVEEQSVIAHEASQSAEDRDSLGDNKDNYQNDAHDTCSKDNEDHGSQKEPDNSEISEESLGELGQLSYQESEREALARDDQEIGHQIDLYHTQTDTEIVDSDGDIVQPAKVKELDIVPEGESISTGPAGDPQSATGPDKELDIVPEDASMSTGPAGDPQSATGPDNEFEEICKSQDLEISHFSEIQSVIKPNHSGQSATAIMGELDVVSEAQYTTNQDVESGGCLHELVEPLEVNGNWKEMDTTLDSSYVTKDHLENVLGPASESDFGTDEVSKLSLDLLSEIQCTLIPDHTVCEDPEITKELDLSEDMQAAVTVDSINDLDIISGSGLLAEGHSENIEISLGIASDTNVKADKISESQGGVDIVSEIESVITASHPESITRSVSIIKLAEEDEAVGGEVDILAGTEPCYTIFHSTEVAGEDVLTEIAMADEPVDTEEDFQPIHNLEEHGSSFEPHQEFEDEVKQHDSSSATVVTEVHVEEADIGLGIISSSKENEIVMTEDIEQSDIKSITEFDLLSEIQSVITSHPAEVTRSVSITKLSVSDEGVGDDVDKLEGTEPCHTMVSSVEGDGVYMLSENVMAAEPVDTEKDDQVISHSEELGSSLLPHEEFEDKMKQFDTSSATLVIETHVEEANIGLGIISIPKESDIVITDNFGTEDIQQSEQKSITEFDLLTEIQSVITASNTSEVTQSEFTIRQSESDDGVRDAVDILEGTEPSHTTVHSAEGDGADVLPEIAMRDELVDTEENAQVMRHSEELGSSLVPHQEFEDNMKQRDSSSTTVMAYTHVDETNIGLDIITTSKDIGIVITTDYVDSENKERPEMKSLTEVDVIQQQIEEKADQQQSSNQEAVTIHSYPAQHGITGLQMVQSQSHTEISEAQERPLVDQKEAIEEPDMQEEDEVDTNMLPHNMLDVSAQRNRVQLRRKTSIRRRQGQRQVVSEIEPAAPPRPSIRPLSMGVPIFPGSLPVFVPAPTTTPPAAEKHTEEKPVADDLAVKPKKVIPKHGFGMPSPQMMQELQARLKKKKPKE
ncbi:uncharacterized protein LOC142097294 isoform X2 [Mixophyes fleayi]|uniref:uncharacterized protein LOC142097294 isoform X2 n=1 Tax=Mixophyes fleayi TaxID=3061075 RepID=UPI003F4D933E